jgi:type IV pili sensor histidine kinase/response regulator
MPGFALMHSSSFSAKFIQGLVKFLVAVFLFTLNSHVFASTSNTQIGRYLTVENKPSLSQMDLLSQTIQVRFPQNIQTVGDAMNYVLRLSGYSLIPSDHMSHALKITLTKPLPAIDRDFGPMPLKDALITLAGPAFYLVQDPLNRLVNFKIKPQYMRLYADDMNIKQAN